MSSTRDSSGMDAGKLDSKRHQTPMAWDIGFCSLCAQRHTGAQRFRSLRVSASLHGSTQWCGPLPHVWQATGGRAKSRVSTP
eukprot:483538-Amphidinium_carterae.1